MKTSSQSKALALIDDIYAAAASFDRWPAALGRIADTFGAQDASLGTMAPHSLPWIFAPRTDPAFMAVYAQNYHPLDTVWHRVTQQGVGAAVTDAMVIGQAELARSQFHNEWSKPQGYKTMLGGMILDDAGWKTVLMMPGQKSYEADAVRLFKLLSPHIARAVQMNIRLAQGSLSGEVTSRLLREMATAALVVDAESRVLFANTAAELWFQPGQGLGLKSGVLSAWRPQDATNLKALIATCARGNLQDSGGVLSLHTAQGLVRQLLVAPMRQSTPLLAPGLPAALIFEIAKATARPTSAELKATYGLTSAEASFALEIAQGDGKQAAAQRRGISFATARTHLSRIFDKTGVRRQAELVRLLLGDKPQ